MCCKLRKDDLSDPSSSDDSDSSDESHYRRKRRKNKKHGGKNTIKLCATLTAKFLITAYKSKMIRFKMDEDPLQRRIYFLTFVELLDVIFIVHRNLWSASRLSKNRRGWCYWRLFKKGYQESFACKYWCKQKMIDCWIHTRWNKMHWEIAITLCKHEFCW